MRAGNNLKGIRIRYFPYIFFAMFWLGDESLRRKSKVETKQARNSNQTVNIIILPTEQVE